MSIETRPLTASEIRELLGNNLYVLNTSDRGRDSRSELLMTFVSRGNSKTAIVHNTWIPLDLTAQISDITLIKDNEDFLYHLRKKNIVVIATDVAEEVLERRDAQEEYNRIYNIKSIATDEVDSIIIGANKSTRNKPVKKDTANTKVLSIVNKESLSENTKIAALKNIKNELNDDDYRYIVNRPAAEDNEKLKAWASAQLS